jgi:hypothetical protein
MGSGWPAFHQVFTVVCLQVVGWSRPAELPTVASESLLGSRGKLPGCPKLANAPGQHPPVEIEEDGASR